MSSKKNSNSLGKQQEIKEDVPEYRSVLMRPLASPRPISLSPPPPMKFAKPLTRNPLSHETTTIRKVSKWNVSNPVTIPPGYLLERINVYLENTTAQECADRVCDCLRSLSISATTSAMDDCEGDLSFDKVRERAVSFLLRCLECS